MLKPIWKAIACSACFATLQLPALLAIDYKNSPQCITELNLQRILAFSSVLFDIHAFLWYILLKNNELPFDASSFLLSRKSMTCYLAISIPLLTFSLYVNIDLLEMFLVRNFCQVQAVSTIALTLAVLLNSLLALVTFVVFCFWFRTVIKRKFARVMVTCIALSIVFVLLASWCFYIQAFSSEELEKDCQNTKTWLNASLLSSILMYAGVWSYPLIYDWLGHRGLLNRRLILTFVAAMFANLTLAFFDGTWFFSRTGIVVDPLAGYSCWDDLSSLSAFLVFSKIPTTTTLLGGLLIAFGSVYYSAKLILASRVHRNRSQQENNSDRALVANSMVRIVKYNKISLGAEERNVTECSICMEDIVCDKDHAVITACDHKYHPNCLNDWLKQSSSCPLCRITIEDSQVPVTL